MNYYKYQTYDDVPYQVCLKIVFSQLYIQFLSGYDVVVITLDCCASSMVLVSIAGSQRFLFSRSPLQGSGIVNSILPSKNNCT